MERRILFDLIIVIILISVGSFYISSFTGLLSGPRTTFATRVIDGDTIEIEGKYLLDIAGIDAPEEGQILFEESKTMLNDLVAGKELIIIEKEPDQDSIQSENRKGHVYINRTVLIGELLVLAGLTFPTDPEGLSPQADIISLAEKKARENNSGIWQYSNIANAFCLYIDYFRNNAIGKDEFNLNDEYIIFSNKCSYPINLNGWKVIESYGKEFEFDDSAIIGSKNTIVLHSGSGEGSSSDVFWGSTEPVWDNAIDSMELRTPDGNSVLVYSYEL